jgi:uncharacterized membrane protein
MNTTRSQGWIPLFALLLLSMAVRLASIDRTTLWFDEVMTAKTVVLPADQLIRERLAKTHSPLFFLMLRMFGLSGDSIFLLRLPAALFGVLGTGAMVFAGRALAGPVIGWMAGLLYAVTPILVDYSQEARPYTAMLLGVVLALGASMRIVRHPRLAVSALNAPEDRRRQLRGCWLLLVVASLWSAWMLSLGLLLWVSLDIGFAFLAVRRKGPWRRLVRPWSVHRLICVALYLPLALALFPRVSANVTVHEISARSIARFIYSTGNAFFFQFYGDPREWAGPFVLVAGSILLMATAFAGVWILRRRNTSIIALTAVVVPMSVLGLVTMYTPVWSRYLLIATPAFTLIAAAGLTAFWKWRAGKLMTAAVALFALLQLADLQRNTRRANWRPVVSAASDSLQPIVFMVRHDHMTVELGFEWNRQRRAGNPRFVSLALVEEQGVHHQPNTSYWLVEPSPNHVLAVSSALGGSQPCCFSYNRGRVVVFPSVQTRELPTDCERLRTLATADCQ